MVEIERWGRLQNGDDVYIATLSDGQGFQASVSTYGATIVSLLVPDRHGAIEDVVLGHTRLEACLQPAFQLEWPYFGSTIGRYANRIAGARFRLDGDLYPLAPNEGGNQVHGGPSGFDRRLWDIEPGQDGVLLSLVSPDGDQGYPGELRIGAEFSIEAPGTLCVRYRATTDQATHINLCTHPYFNLAGRGSRSVAGHRLTIAAEAILPIDDRAIPTWDGPMPVEGTPFDFRNGRVIGAALGQSHPQLLAGDGLNHCFILETASPVAAQLDEPDSGRRLEIETNQPGLQIYSSNAFNGALADEQGRPFVRHQALAIEAQHWPDSPNRPDFPSTRLDPGEAYCARTLYRFSAQDSPGAARRHRQPPRRA